jgi:energy-coupling factor transporter ATP-binding protein EcfA2
MQNHSSGYSPEHRPVSAEDQSRLQELRQAWGVSADGPLLVIGRLTGSLRADMPDVFFLSDLIHPTDNHELVYPQEDSRRGTQAFVPPREIEARLRPEDAVTGKYWAIAELELAPQKVREQRNNPHECNVRSGTLHQLSALPSEWKIDVRGPQNAPLIAGFARDQLEAAVREEVLRDNTDLADRQERNSRERQQIEADLKATESHAEGLRAQIESQIDSESAMRDAIHADVADLQKTLAAEIEQLEEFRRRNEQERQVMEERYRRLQHLLSEKGTRLVALGLIDEEDLSFMLPNQEQELERSGASLDEALGGDIARLAPWLQARLAGSGLMYSQAQLRNFVALLQTRDLVVLAGDSGSGKTSLVRAVAEAVGGVCTILPVKPNWTGPEDLLGYYNPIERSYHPTPFLLALQAAAREPDVPHFICLDEMNLARVEHYFADFLSLLENRSSSPEIHLYSADEERHLVMEHGIFLELEAEARRRANLDEDATFEELLKNDKANDALRQLGGFRDAETVLLHHARLRRALSAQMRIPTSLRFPENVWILGAVNMDETTHHLSPKVLDRVHVLRFGNPMLADWDAIEVEISDVTEDPSLSITLTPRDIGERTNYPAFDRSNDAAHFLAALARDHLDPIGVEFGLRAVRQSLGYLAAAERTGIAPHEALDNVIGQKILPKITLDMSRPAADGRKRRDVLLALREAVNDRLEDMDALSGKGRSVEALDRLITMADGNNSVANYWMR